MGKAPEQQKTETGPWKPYEPYYKKLGGDLMNLYKTDKPGVWGVPVEKGPMRTGDGKGPKGPIVNPGPTQLDRDEYYYGPRNRGNPFQR